MSEQECIFFNIDKPKNEKCCFNINEKFRSYIENVLLFIKNGNEIFSNKNNFQVSAEDIYSILISKEFNYQSKNKILHLKDFSIHIIEKNIELKKPIPLFYSVGGGYKATINKECLSDLNFSLGLGELLIIYQICKLEEKIKKIYEPGIIFNIIIDNGVANFVNGIPIDKTQRYAESYEKLIKILGKSDSIRLIVQTRDMNWENESNNIQIGKAREITDDEYCNILRFIGHECSREEAVVYQARYSAAMDFSAKLIKKHIGDEIWMLQYSNGKSLTFRSFPGGAARIQAGDIALKIENEKVRPFLLSIKNINEFKALKHECSLDYFMDNFLIKNDNMKKI